MKKYAIFILLLIHQHVFSSDCELTLYLPFHSGAERIDDAEMSSRLLDGFGAYRSRGHKHAGLDISGDYCEKVYSLGKGQIVALYDTYPYQTVLVKHVFNQNEIIYSAYTHLEDIEVKIDQNVDENTAIGRLFTEEEFRKSGFKKNHLHLEIRKSIERYKRISVQCKTIEELNQYFYDPYDFLKKHHYIKK